MATIEQARANRARDVLNQSVDNQQEARSDVRTQVAKGQEAKRGGPQRGATDGVDTKSAAAPGTLASVGENGLAATTSGPNPFATLVASGASTVATSTILLAQQVPMEAQLNPEVHQLLSLGAFEMAAFARGKTDVGDSVAKVRTGTLLVMTDDAAQAEAGLGSQVHASAMTLSEKLAAHAAGQNGEKPSRIVEQHVVKSPTTFPAGMDVNAYVQAVLRESYMLQQDILKDMAVEMKAANEKRKEIREKLNRLKELKAKLSEGLTDAELDELEALGLDVDRDDLEALEADFVWEGDAELAAAEQDLASLQAPSATVGSPTPAATATYAPLVTDQVTDAFTPVHDSAPASQALFNEICKWYETQRNHGERNREDVFIHKFSMKDGKAVESKEKLDQAAVEEALRRFGSTMPDDLLADFLKTLYTSATDADGTEHSEDNKKLLDALVDSLSPDQLATLKNGHNELWLSIDVASGGALSTRAKAYEKLSYSGLSSDSPALDDAYDAFMVAQVKGFSEPYLSQAQEKMGALNGAEAREFLSKTQSKLDGGTFDKFLTACNPGQLFDGATPESLAYFKAKGPEAQAIFALWSNESAPPEVPAEAVSSTPAEVKAKAIETAQKKVDDLKAQRSEAAGAAAAEKYKDALDEKLEALVSATEEDLASVGEDAQMLQLRIQEAQQKAQELMQMMSNLSKMVHDTMMAIIRNMGG